MRIRLSTDGVAVSDVMEMSTGFAVPPSGEIGRATGKFEAHVNEFESPAEFYKAVKNR